MLLPFLRSERNRFLKLVLIRFVSGTSRPSSSLTDSSGAEALAALVALAALAVLAALAALAGTFDPVASVETFSLGRNFSLNKKGKIIACVMSPLFHYTVKKGSRVSRLQPGPAQGEFNSDIPAGDGKLANLFFTV
jgi:hypothetical protein